MIDQSAITAFIDKIVALRPKSLAHFNSGGRWTHLVEGFKAQLALNRARAMREAVARRLAMASGDELRQLAASEYDTLLDSNPTHAEGVVIMGRSGGLPAGVIRKGQKFVKEADPDATPVPIAAAEYESIEPVYVATGVAQATVKVRAVSPGPAANVLLGTGAFPTLITPGTGLFDATFATTGCEAGGGSSGVKDEDLVRASKAYASGRFGPTQGAIIAGALRGLGVRHYLYEDFGGFDAASLLSGDGVSRLWVADESWGSSSRLCENVLQLLSDRFQGWGCRLRVRYVVNSYVTVTATVRLRKSQYMSNTTEVEASIRKALRWYFDERTDWNRLTTEGMKMAITNADARILSCSAVTCVDEAGLSQLDNVVDPAQLTRIHFYFRDEAATMTFLPPN